MGEVKHTPTPGPWRAFEDRIYGICRDGREHIIVDCDSPYVQDAEANARLIAAAPDMLVALKAIVDLQGKAAGGFPLSEDENRAWALANHNARAAIAAAEGR